MQYNLCCTEKSKTEQKKKTFILVLFCKRAHPPRQARNAFFSFSFLLYTYTYKPTLCVCVPLSLCFSKSKHCAALRYRQEVLTTKGGSFILYTRIFIYSTRKKMITCPHEKRRKRGRDAISTTHLRENELKPPTT